MEAQRQLVHVDEGLVGELADRMLADAGKQCVTQLVEANLQDPGEIIEDDKRDGAEQEGRQKTCHIDPAIQRIGRPFEEIGDEDQDKLRDDQEDGGPDHPHLQIEAVGRPHVGPEVDQGLHWVAVVGRYCFLLRLSHPRTLSLACRSKSGDPLGGPPLLLN